MSGKDTRVLSYGDVFLRARDVELLDPPNWLNDAIITFYFEYLQTECIREAKFMCLEPSLSFWLANCPDQAEFRQTLTQLGLSEKDVILLAVNDNREVDTYGGGTHWSLLAFFRGENISEGRFVHYDSANGSNRRYAQQLANLLSPELLGRRVEIVSETSPQQMNGWDCGVYVLGLANTLCKWYTTFRDQDPAWLIAENVTPEKISRLRLEVKELILHLAAREMKDAA
jgi:sentrin-specific protease 8